MRHESTGRELAILIVLLLLAGVVYLFLMRDTARAECYAVPLTEFTPTGIAGCEVWGEGIASHYGPGEGVAMNFCTWELRHSQGCGMVRVVSLATGLGALVPVIDFCDCYTGTPDQRIIDLQYGVLAKLGLDLAEGLYEVRVWPVGQQQGSANLPDTAVLQ